MLRGALYLSSEWQAVPWWTKEYRDAASKKGLSQALTGLTVAWHNQAKHAAGHALQHACVRLHLQFI